MKSLYRNIIYQAKNNFRDGGFIFWSLLYPIIMATFFYIAFSGITDIEIEEIKVGIEEGNPISPLVKNIDILTIEEVSSEESENKLKNGEIEVFIKNNLGLAVIESGLNENVVKSILDQIVQTDALNRPIEDFDYDVNYIESTSQENDWILIIFYSLIGMVSTYGIFVGLESSNYIQANLSALGARINTTPIKKYNFLASGIIVGLGLNIITNTILLLFIEFILDLDLINELGYSILFILLGNLLGISLGFLIGVSNKLRDGIKSSIAITSTLFLSALSGLFSVDIKLLIEEHAPIIAEINPIAVITNNLYKINLLGITDDSIRGILILVAYSAIFFLISLVFLRRKTYDSL